MKTYLDKLNKEILRLKLEGGSKLEIQKLQQKKDELIEKDMHGLKDACPYNFLYWN